MTGGYRTVWSGTGAGTRFAALPAEAGFHLIRAVSGSARLVNSEGFEPRLF